MAETNGNSLVDRAQVLTARIVQIRQTGFPENLLDTSREGIAIDAELLNWFASLGLRELSQARQDNFSAFSRRLLNNKDFDRYVLLTTCLQYFESLLELEEAQIIMDLLIQDSDSVSRDLYKTRADLRKKDFDPLTSCLLVRGAAYEHLKIAISRGRFNDSLVLCAIGDLDHFKRVNDTYGHSFGDTVLKQSARAWHTSFRPTDIDYRFGGEELGLWAPIRDLQAGGSMMDRARIAIEAQQYPDHSEHKQTISIGFSIGGPDVSENLNRPVVRGALLLLADRGLYSAKKAGRNGIHLASSKEFCPNGVWTMEQLEKFIDSESSLKRT